MIFFDQFKVPTIKFGKCFAKFMIPLALLKKFGSYEFVTIIEVSNMRRCSGKANKLRYICTIRGTKPRFSKQPIFLIVQFFVDHHAYTPIKL